VTGKRRRAHGEGSVYQRADGMWVAAVDLGWIDGKRRRRVVYGKTEQEAIGKRDDLRRQLQLGVDLGAPPRTLAAWLAEWLNDVKAHDGTRASTQRRYREVFNTHLGPGLGKIRLDRLNARDVQRFLTMLRGRLAPATIIKIHGVLRAALSDAERLDLVPRNVAKSAKPPSLGRLERRALTPVEAKSLLGELVGDRLEGLFVVAIATGLRRGEVLGLRWSDVDLAGGTLYVRRSPARRRRTPVRAAEDSSLGSADSPSRHSPQCAGGPPGPPGQGAGGGQGTVGGRGPGLRKHDREADGAPQCQPALRESTDCGGPGVAATTRFAPFLRDLPPRPGPGVANGDGFTWPLDDSAYRRYIRARPAPDGTVGR